MRNVILYISCTLDGYISKPNDDLSFLEKMQIEGEDYGYSKFVKNVDTIIIGRKTYEWIINQGFEYPHADKDVYIITRRKKDGNDNLTYYNGDINELITTLKSKSGKDIYCDGGAEIVNLLLKNSLIDEMIISVVPTVIGNGTKLFHSDIPEKELKLIDTKSFSTGMVQLHYAF